MYQLRRASRNTNDEIPSRIPWSLCRGEAGMLGVNGGRVWRDVEWKWGYHLKEGTLGRSENLLEVQTMI